MATDLAKAAKDRGIKYFMISYTDLFGTQRAKLVPSAAIVARPTPHACRAMTNWPPVAGWGTR